ncbi:2-oxo-3-hexenedioate decarboxylase [Noviherbaspirillum sedimenti]|uniref:2-oxo-3-hexenedioate decarboxylase n=1 Tax=Noviherbaspirillum sedimenti TaxID=2320865 RepID=A0A3A3GMK3_9BURK|nr:2-oxo-3-hexenedioate decarboxylase [Noviherbaspirillum sedimenti]RJG03526.1 2-oxo-3-hexenedioate decarboxylase [Noviherbaspirillum sedimenti]
MKLTASQIAELAEYLESAHLERREVVKITDRYPDIDMDDAYAIQNQVRQRKLARGEKVVGLKCGLTSYAKMQQMGVETPIFGFMTDAYVVPEASEIRMAELIHPKVEPEIAFFTKTPIRGPGCDIGAVLAATDFVMAAIEVIDSRYRDFKFDLVSVIADNTSATRFIVGGKATPVADLDLAKLGVVMEKNGKVEMVGAGAAVVGHPATAVAMLANHLAASGEEIPAGSIILSGGITEAIPVQAGDSISLQVQSLGGVTTRFV